MWSPMVLLFTYFLICGRESSAEITEQPRFSYCVPGKSCWPTQHEVSGFRNKLHGELIPFGSPRYNKLLYQCNKLFTRYPAYIVLVKTTEDIQRSIRFARHHDIRITVYSCGHDYAGGRSTANDSLQINLSEMKQVVVNDFDLKSTTNSSVWVQSGATWDRVYKKLDVHKKSVVGGGCGKVCVAGYTLGGGVSILSRSYGLSVDNVIAFTMILYNGTKVSCFSNQTTIWHNSSQESTVLNSDLFWAVLGGGGGTFGIIESFIFRIFDAPSSFVRYSVLLPLEMTDSEHNLNYTSDFLSELLRGLSEKWGAYISLQASKFGNNDLAKNINVKSTVRLLLLYNGPWNYDCWKTYKKLEHFKPELRLHDLLTNYSSFLDYTESLNYAEIINLYAVSSNIRLYTSTLRTLLPQLNGLVRDTDIKTTCDMTLIGGEIKRVGAQKTSVNPEFRLADLVASCSVDSLPGPKHDISYEIARRLAEILSSHGRSSYLNEGLIFDRSWAFRYWGTRYNRLLEIKRRVDPYSVFTCHHCVGSEKVVRV